MIENVHCVEDCGMSYSVRRYHPFMEAAKNVDMWALPIRCLSLAKA